MIIKGCSWHLFSNHLRFKEILIISIYLPKHILFLFGNIEYVSPTHVIYLKDWCFWWNQKVITSCLVDNTLKFFTNKWMKREIALFSTNNENRFINFTFVTPVYTCFVVYCNLIHNHFIYNFFIIIIINFWQTMGLAHIYSPTHHIHYYFFFSFVT